MREKLIELIKKWMHSLSVVNGYEGLADYLLTHNVVEVVRCKDCKWWEKQSDSLQGRCGLFVNHFMYPTGNWYCANGKRKKDEE